MYPPHPIPVPSNSYQDAQRSHLYPACYNSHYLQAYWQQTGVSQFNSSTGSQSISTNPGIQWKTGLKEVRPSHRPFGYQPGNSRCSHLGCSFSGSSKTVEIHMMDRHLIYPPGWESRRRKSDWDADPSLKGKPIPIQGTNIVLDTPEILEAWIKERRSRFPTAARIADKKRKLEEAAARGQLDLTDSRWPNKRRHIDTSMSFNDGRTRRSIHSSRGRLQEIQTSAGSDITKVSDCEESQAARTNESHPSKSSALQPDPDSGDDAEPRAVSSKIVPSEYLRLDDKIVPILKAASADSLAINRIHLQPRPPRKNPFASRPTLLRNLLLPEIRITISNLSQAIRFLVDNDFLRDVELNPGQATEFQKIEVLESKESLQSEEST